MAARVRTLLSKLWLVVEDEDGHFILLQRACERLNPPPRLLRLANGFEAQQYLAGEGMFGDRRSYPLPGVILSDIRMPLYSGFELLEWVKGQSNLRAIPFLILSSSNHPLDKDRARRLGALGYVEKPPQVTALVGALQEGLA